MDFHIDLFPGLGSIEPIWLILAFVIVGALALLSFAVEEIRNAISYIVRPFILPVIAVSCLLWLMNK
ncbi:hypothetical protein BAMA_20445 [Bacillus manliponensis]|uniref:Uncharacterized protein n=1 Tax=Bacillus manliponensis TaxID=574376 RepID=A0A073KBG1_9BACI|nr:hypothetical protein [Bacillus manliponensis]KEK19638.1 hypothetical protein BAMA_20445 [Bacillus manliponensis]